MWLPLVCPQLRTWTATPASALTRNQPLVTGSQPMLNPLSYTSQGHLTVLDKSLKNIWPSKTGSQPNPIPGAPVSSLKLHSKSQTRGDSSYLYCVLQLLKCKGNFWVCKGRASEPLVNSSCKYFLHTARHCNSQAPGI